MSLYSFFKFFFLFSFIFPLISFSVLGAIIDIEHIYWISLSLFLFDLLSENCLNHTKIIYISLCFNISHSEFHLYAKFKVIYCSKISWMNIKCELVIKKYSLHLILCDTFFFLIYSKKRISSYSNCK